jgi:hypothetical protein
MNPPPGYMTAVHTRIKQRTAKPRFQVPRPVPDHPGVSVRESPSVMVGTIGAAAARVLPIGLPLRSVLWIRLQSCISILDIFSMPLPYHGYAGHLGHTMKRPTAWNKTFMGSPKTFPRP